jgi:hypothetical protein
MTSGATNSEALTSVALLPNAETTAQPWTADDVARIAAGTATTWQGDACDLAIERGWPMMPFVEACAAERRRTADAALPTVSMAPLVLNSLAVAKDDDAVRRYADAYGLDALWLLMEVSHQRQRMGTDPNTDPACDAAIAGGAYAKPEPPKPLAPDPEADARQRAARVEHDREERLAREARDETRGEWLRFVLDAADAAVADIGPDDITRLKLQLLDQMIARFGKAEYIHSEVKETRTFTWHSPYDNVIFDAIEHARKALMSGAPTVKGPPGNWYTRVLWPMQNWLASEECPVNWRDVSTFHVLVQHASAKTLETRPGARLVGRLTRRSEEAARRSLKALEAVGAVKVKHVGGNHRATTYVLTVPEKYRK